MADGDGAPAGGRPAGGGALSRKVAGAPLWVWVLGGTVVVAGGYLLLRGRGKKPAADDTTSGTGSPSYASPDPYSIIPVNQGLGTQQAQDLKDYIAKLYGPNSEAVKYGQQQHQVAVDLRSQKLDQQRKDAAELARLRAAAQVQRQRAINDEKKLAKRK